MGCTPVRQQDRQTDDENDGNDDTDRYRKRDRGYTQMRRPTKLHLRILKIPLLNKGILRIRDAREFCNLISMSKLPHPFKLLSLEVLQETCSTTSTVHT